MELVVDSADRNIEQVRARGRYDAFVIYVKTVMDMDDVLSADAPEGFFKVALHNIAEIKSAFKDNWGEEQEDMVAYLQDFLNNPIEAILSLVNFESIQSMYDRFYSNLQKLNQKKDLTQADIEELKKIAQEVMDQIERLGEFGEPIDTVEFKSMISTLSEFIDHPENLLTIRGEGEDDVDDEDEPVENTNWGNLPVSSAPFFSPYTPSKPDSDSLVRDELVRDVECRYKNLIDAVRSSLSHEQIVKKSEIILMVQDMIDDIVSNGLEVTLNDMLTKLYEVKTRLEDISPNYAGGMPMESNNDLVQQEFSRFSHELRRCIGDKSALSELIVKAEALREFILSNGFGDSNQLTLSRLEDFLSSPSQYCKSLARFTLDPYVHNVEQNEEDSTSDVDGAQQDLQPLPSVGLDEMPFFHADVLF